MFILMNDYMWTNEPGTLKLNMQKAVSVFKLILVIACEIKYSLIIMVDRYMKIVGVNKDMKDMMVQLM